jgi:hypothetical protein
MANSRPARTKKSTAAITNPDNVANFTLKSHKTAARLADSSKSQAVTRLPSPAGSLDTHLGDHTHGKRTAPPTTSGESGESEDFVPSEDDLDLTNVKEEVGRLKCAQADDSEGMYYSLLLKD